MQSDTIVDELLDLDRALGETGYAFAEIDEPELLIDHQRVEGDLTLPVRPNGKYVFGDVLSSDETFLSGRHLASIARFEPGDTYQRSLEFDLRRAITATDLSPPSRWRRAKWPRRKVTNRVSSRWTSP